MFAYVVDLILNVQNYTMFWEFIESACNIFLTDLFWVKNMIKYLILGKKKFFGPKT